MSLTEAKKQANKRYDQKNMAYQTIKVKRDLLEEFRQRVQDNGQQVNTVFREFMEGYIKENTRE